MGKDKFRLIDGKIRYFEVGDHIVFHRQRSWKHPVVWEVVGENPDTGLLLLSRKNKAGSVVKKWLPLRNQKNWTQREANGKKKKRRR